MAKKLSTTDTVEAPAKTEVQSYSSLNELLAGYQKPMTIEVEKPESAPGPGPVDDKSDPKKYYQSGAKKGQPRSKATGPAPIASSQPQEKATLSGELLTGALFLTLVDLLFPMLIAMLNNKFSKHKIKPDDLSLTEKQKKDLEPLSNEVVKYININGHPVLLFTLAMGGIYGINLMQLKIMHNEMSKK